MAWKKILLEGDAAVLSDVAPVDVDFLVAAAGVATTASRQDHKHDVPESLVGDLVNPLFVGAAIGSANKFIRADHRHGLTEGTLTNLQPVDGTAESLGTADALLRADHIHALGPMAANININQKQLIGQVMHVTPDPPNVATEVEGQIYYDSSVGDKHPYVWVP